MPFKETGFVDEVLYQKIFAIPREAGEVRDFVQRRYRGAEDMKDNESELPFLAELRKPMSLKARNVDDSSPARTSMTVTLEVRHRVENTHLVGDRSDIDDFANVGMKAL